MPNWNYWLTTNNVHSAYKLIMIGTQPMATRPLKLLFSQQTGSALQELLPTPMTLMGEQSIPIGVVRSWITMPRVPSKVEAAEDDAG